LIIGSHKDTILLWVKEKLPSLNLISPVQFHLKISFKLLVNPMISRFVFWVKNNSQTPVYQHLTYKNIYKKSKLIALKYVNIYEH